MSFPDMSTCTSCYGEGEINTDTGPYLGPDCKGNGRTDLTGEQIEERIRQIEVELERHPLEARPETRWLLFELRRTRKLLWQIRSYCHEAGADEDQPLISKIRDLADAAVAPRSPALPREMLPEDA
jgi:hypothetical protein